MDYHEVTKGTKRLPALSAPSFQRFVSNINLIRFSHGALRVGNKNRFVSFVTSW